jgi:hypothetical protein
MCKIKTLGAVGVLFLFAAIATPAFAKHMAHDSHAFRRSYNQMTASYWAVPSSKAERNIENFGFSGRDPSRPGGWFPYFNPPS